MTRRSTASRAMGRSTGQKATDTGRGRGHSTWTEESGWESNMKRHTLTDRPPTPTRPNLPRSSEAQRNVPGVEILSMQPRRSWGQESRGIRTASDVQNVARAWSPPLRRRKTEKSTAKPVTPRTSGPKASVTAKEPAPWFTLSDGSTGSLNHTFIHSSVQHDIKQLFLVFSPSNAFMLK